MILSAPQIIPDRPAYAPEHKQAFDEIVTRRRSFRAFEAEPMPEEALTHALHLATLSANSSNLQTWEFHWVREPARKAKLATACLGQPGAVTAPDLVVLVFRRRSYKKRARFMLDYLKAEQAKNPGLNPQKKKQQLKYYGSLMPMLYWHDWLGIKGRLLQLTQFLVGLGKPTMRQVSKTDLRLMGHRSLALAGQTLMLAVSAAGYDTLSMEGIDSKRVKQALGLRNCEVGWVIAVGKGKQPEGLYGPRIRVPAEEVIMRYE